MIPEKVEILIDDQPVHWFLGHEISPFVVNENQKVKINICFDNFEDAFKIPRLDVEDHSVQLRREDVLDEAGRKIVRFSSSAEKIFRESFGIAFLRLYIEDEEFTLPFEVLATKITASQAEQMIEYLTKQREHIIRVCLSRTMRPTGTKNDGWSDPEIIISTAERIIDTILECRDELRQHIRSKLVPAKIPAWKAEKSGCLIDPVDVIFNLDSLRPADGRQDVVLRGRTYSTSAINVMALVRDTNVQENAVLIGGLYSIRRVISELLDEISSAFKGCQIAVYDKEYVQLGEMLMKLTGGAMYTRCEHLISATESLIRMVENEFGIVFSGETYPKITPHVRSSRIYRNIFEQYTHWYNLGSPSIDGDLFLVKLRSLSKIFEFFVLFRLFEFFEGNKWSVVDFSMNEEFEKLVPSVVIFEKDELKVTLSYEPSIYKFSKKTNNMDLLKIHHYDFPGNKWIPDYVIRIDNESSGLTRYIILDAKYSSKHLVEKFHIDKISDKYYYHMAVFDKRRNFISRNEIIGVFAVFPEGENEFSKAIGVSSSNFDGNDIGPVFIPMVAGFPISMKGNKLMENSLDKVLGEVCRSMSF